MSASLEKDFYEILDHITEEEYNRCTSSASSFLTTHRKDPDAKDYLPYVEFFKLFADGYHTWQGSYHYTPIRGSFLMAADRLTPLANEPDHEVVVAGLQTLCKMLVEYTWCENSAINNDPFALKHRSQLAIDYEEIGLKGLRGFSSKVEYLNAIVEWLRDYFTKNLHLHTGLNACANIYARIMHERRCSKAVFIAQMERANKAFDELAPLSPELSSELNAHIRHVQRHYERLVTPSGPPTFLRVRSGKLVLSLSAACSRAGVKRILKDGSHESREFMKEAEDQLKLLGIVVDKHSFRPTPLMDIFETSFGDRFLKSLTFDIKSSTKLTEPETDPSKPVKLSFPGGDGAFDFSLSVTLSTLGTCTVAFELEINEKKFTNGISVEKIRALESCICPHAGHVELRIGWTDDAVASPAGFLDRVDIILLREKIEALSDPAIETSKIKVVEELDAYREHTLNEAHGMTATDRQNRDEKLCNAVNNLIRDVTNPLELREHRDCCLSHTRLAEFGEQVLEGIKQAFLTATKPDNIERDALSGIEAWNFRPDLGWYAYLYTIRIDEVGNDLVSVREAVSFSDILDHPDTPGLVIDQREARASFDDWRFMERELSKDDNLAYVRSHDSDAFYTSEFQTFFYFPDDPKYIVDQYEETVKLNLRLNVGLRFYNWMAEDLTDQIRNEDRPLLQDEQQDPEHAVGVAPLSLIRRALRHFDPRKLPGVKHTLTWVRHHRHAHIGIQRLQSDLERVRRLRFEANELRNLVSKAGVSRYHDHGQFMKKILDKTNVEAAAEITDRQLGQLEVLSKEIIERIRESRAKGLRNAGIAVTSLFGASASKDFFEVLFRGDRQGLLISIFMVIAFFLSLTIFILLGKSSDK